MLISLFIEPFASFSNGMFSSFVLDSAEGVSNDYHGLIRIYMTGLGRAGALHEGGRKFGFQSSQTND